MSQALPNQLPPVPLDEAQQQRLRKLYTEIRCLVCQNQSLADSAADLAVDLRHEVQSQIAKGSSDEQIKRWLVQRYGDFVLYKPQMQASTACGQTSTCKQNHGARPTPRCGHRARERGFNERSHREIRCRSCCRMATLTGS
ncbi:MAG: cytochrome c-type biogenesis protein CcmH [Betaproteobacteria bacterium]|nr:cytochrome c-type biogenesis protein CcmH [Betaproteobacteria bacterium]